MSRKTHIVSNVAHGALCVLLVAIATTFVFARAAPAQGAGKIKPYVLKRPPVSSVYEDGSGTNRGKPFCIATYGCSRSPNEGGGPRWAHTILAIDYTDGDFNGRYHDRPIYISVTHD